MRPARETAKRIFWSRERDGGADRAAQESQGPRVGADELDQTKARGPGSGGGNSQGSQIQNYSDGRRRPGYVDGRVGCRRRIRLSPRPPSLDILRVYESYEA